jgi:multicomponent Na+:H+ antiporter subunit F
MMNEFLTLASGFVLVTVAVGFVRIVRGPQPVDRMMAAQLFGTGGIAALLLRAAATDAWALIDVALILALLAAFASAGFVISGSPVPDDDREVVGRR